MATNAPGAGPAAGTGTAATVTVSDLIAWFRRFAELIEHHGDELSSLDAAIGDADHGTNLRRGCRAVLSALDGARPEGAAGFGRSVAMQLISAVGGASGPLYGSFFLAFGTSAGTNTDLTAERFVDAWRAGVEGVAARGKAEPGDKTMLDALTPAVDAMAASLADGGPIAAALRAAQRAAEDGVAATVPMVARKGRASYLGERSVGHQDPGATSSWLLVRAAAETLGAERWR